jgi:serine/threonine protein kinase
VELVAAVAETLHDAHGKGLVHRDIKPGHILLDAGGKLFSAAFLPKEPVFAGAGPEQVVFGVKAGTEANRWPVPWTPWIRSSPGFPAQRTQINLELRSELETRPWAKRYCPQRNGLLVAAGQLPELLTKGRR